MPNRYAQVALTYLRRPFSSWFAGLASILFACMLIALSVQDAWLVQLMLLFSLFGFLAIHMKGQFADSRAHLTPGFRRVHATVAAVAAMILAVVLPTLLAWFMGWHSIGFVAVAVLLFGTILWTTVKEAAWTYFAILAGFVAVAGTESGVVHFRQLIFGQLEPQAVALLGLGALVTVLAGIRLVRLNKDMPGYHTGMQWDGTQRAWSDQWRILPRLMDWIRERQMARLTRLARQASESWWSRICRWQVGMVAGWSLWLWILGMLIYVQAMIWWLYQARSPAAIMGGASVALTFLPTLAALPCVLQWRTFKLRYELSLPVERKSYIRQLGTAAALSHFQMWGGMSLGLVLWWLVAGPRPPQIAQLAGVLAFSAAFQVVFFGVVVWTARYRSGALLARLTGIVVLALFAAAQAFQMQQSMSSPGLLPHKVMWIAGVIAVLGLLITLDAYRRWLVTEFD